VSNTIVLSLAMQATMIIPRHHHYKLACN